MQQKKSTPKPQWGLLKFMNFLITGVFVGSVAYVAVNYKNAQNESLSPLTNTFFPVMVLWCFCLAYFFGFFGISFVDTDSLAASPSTYNLDEARREAEALSNAHHDQNTRKPITSLQAEAAKTQTATSTSSSSSSVSSSSPVRHVPRNDTPICAERAIARPTDAQLATAASADIDWKELDDDLIFEHLSAGTLKDYQLESKLGPNERAVSLRRRLYESLLQKDLDLIPYEHFNYGNVFGANCEIVIGYVPIPVGVVGPLKINAEDVYIPMATTEGCLVASVNRGCKAITASGGCLSVVLKDAITRAPCIRMPSAMRAAQVKKWCAVPENYLRLEAAFNGTTSFGKLHSCEGTVAGRNVYLRFSCMSGDAMGMNMVSKGCLAAIDVLQAEFPDLVLVAISGNMCTDKKPAAINWILGRGKSIVVEAVIHESVVKSVLKSSVHDMIETNKQKNHIGSAMAGSIGGFNAQAANMVTAVFLATGQDPAQNVESSNCLTIMEYAEDGHSLHVSCTMPSIEVGTVGGGTSLPAQAGCLDIMGVRGASRGLDSHGRQMEPGDNARKLAQIVGGAVLAGELSLMAALAANHLVRSHMQHNRKPASSAEAPEASSSASAPKKGMSKSSSMPDMTHAKAVSAH